LRVNVRMCVEENQFFGDVFLFVKFAYTPPVFGVKFLLINNERTWEKHLAFSVGH